MATVIPYLVFPGQCKEAMQFYADCLNGEITTMQTFEESPIDVPSELGSRIFNSELKAGNLRLKASDDLPNHSVSMGTNISLYVTFPDKQTKVNVFKRLSEGGKVLFPLDDNFGMLKDKYNVQWMVVDERH